MHLVTNASKLWWTYGMPPMPSKITIAEFESFDASKCKPSCWFECSGVYVECTSSNVEWWDALSA